MEKIVKKGRVNAAARCKRLPANVAQYHKLPKGKPPRRHLAAQGGVEFKVGETCLAAFREKGKAFEAKLLKPEAGGRPPTCAIIVQRAQPDPWAGFRFQPFRLKLGLPKG